MSSVRIASDVSVSYLDSSAGLKLVMQEPESEAMRRYVADHSPWTSSAIFRSEILRAARRGDSHRVAAARALLSHVALLAIDDELLAQAAELNPPALRTLDAIHLATALRLADDLEAIVTYDRRMIEGARSLGLPVASPA